MQSMITFSAMLLASVDVVLEKKVALVDKQQECEVRKSLLA